MKRTERNVVTFLIEDEVNALLAACDSQTDRVFSGGPGLTPSV